jgi:two-component system response regulator MprA
MNVIDVLVAEDDEDTRDAVVRAVNSLAYHCRSARDGREALAEQERNAAAIVLAEWHLPRLHGLALCRALKRERRPPYVIVMTTERARRGEAVGAGADDFLLKPFGLDELEIRLDAAHAFHGERDRPSRRAESPTRL